MRRPLSWTKLCSIFFAIMMMITCRQVEKRERADSLSAPPPSRGEAVLVEAGDSSQPSYHPLGNRMLFVSKGRPGHTHAQVYEKDLATGAERRITFQDGDTSTPRYHPKEEQILYSSSTDELKEHPAFLKETDLPTRLPATYQQPVEIYLHALQSLDIQRITQRRGFDGEARFGADGHTLYWTRATGAGLEVVTSTRGQTNPHPVKGVPRNASQFVVSPNNVYRAWIEWDDAFGLARLRMQTIKTPAVIREITPDAVVNKTDPSFSADSQYLFWSQWDPGSKMHRIWGAHINAGPNGGEICARLWEATRNVDGRDPVLSPDGQWLTYTRIQNGRSRIWRTPFVTPTAPCQSTP